MYLYRMLVEEYFVNIFIEGHDRSGLKVLEEAKQRGAIHLVGKYSADIHPPHITQGQLHIEVYARNNKIFAMNSDGTAHDMSHGIRIPNKVANAIRDKLPRFSIPPDQIIESVVQIEMDDQQRRLLNILCAHLIR